MKREVLRNSYFERRLVIATECTMKEFLEKFDLSEYEDENEQAVTIFEKGCGYIWLGKPKNSIVAHELMHFLYAMFEYVGMPLTKSSQEAYANGMDFYMRKIMKKFQLKLE